MGERTKARGFQDVDATGAADALAAYLDGVGGVAGVQAYKRRVLGALGVGPGDRALDVGCGTGEDVRALAGIVGERGRAVGVDRSQAFVEEARRRSGKIGMRGGELVRADAQALPFADGSFDGVRCERLLQHVADPARVVAEMARVTRAGGRVVAADADHETLVVDMSDHELVRRIVRHRCDRARNGWVGRQLAALFVDAGLDVVVVPETLVARDLALSEAVVELRAVTEDAVRAGVIAADESARFWRELEERSASGRFFSAITGFVAVGTRR